MGNEELLEHHQNLGYDWTSSQAHTSKANLPTVRTDVVTTLAFRISFSRIIRFSLRRFKDTALPQKVQIARELLKR